MYSYDKIECECGSILCECYLKRHLQSNIHKLNLFKKNQKQELFNFKVEQIKKREIKKTPSKIGDKKTVSFTLSILD